LSISELNRRKPQRSKKSHSILDQTTHTSAFSIHRGDEDARRKKDETEILPTALGAIVNGSASRKEPDL
jgi:hypothetical protein